MGNCGSTEDAKQQPQPASTKIVPASNASNASATTAAKPVAAAVTKKITKVLILVYSTYGHCIAMARAAAEGVKEVQGAEVSVKRVPETLPDEVLTKLHAVDAQKAFADVPIADPNELAEYDGIIFVTPTRFGMMAAQLKTFLDATGQLWFQGKLVGKVGSVITSTGGQHGGQESTILNFHTVLLHHGMTIAGLPPSWGKHGGITEVQGCSFYGASTIANADGSRMPSEVELDGAKFQGKIVAEYSKKLSA